MEQKSRIIITRVSRSLISPSYDCNGKVFLPLLGVRFLSQPGIHSRHAMTLCRRCAALKSVVRKRPFWFLWGSFSEKKMKKKMKDSGKPQSHIHDFGPGRATVNPDLASR